ncbi:MAG TPA: low molecular weight phosphatase family protein [Anaerolineaceae bacterium]|nr:low molecular weight phosphatase family protein [Anaerolineaceae bacterium]
MPVVVNDRKKVLFLCIGNSCRSQMAEALLRKYAANRFIIYSAGLEPSTIHPYTIRVLQELGIDTSEQFSKSLTKYLDGPIFDYIITVCSDAEERCPVFPGSGIRLHWSFEDPAVFEGDSQAKLDKFREIRDQIDATIQNWLHELDERTESEK